MLQGNGHLQRRTPPSPTGLGLSSADTWSARSRTTNTFLRPVVPVATPGTPGAFGSNVTRGSNAHFESTSPIGDLDSMIQKTRLALNLSEDALALFPRDLPLSFTQPFGDLPLAATLPFPPSFDRRSRTENGVLIAAPLDPKAFEFGSKENEQLVTRLTGNPLLKKLFDGGKSQKSKPETVPLTMISMLCSLTGLPRNVFVELQNAYGNPIDISSYEDLGQFIGVFLMNVSMLDSFAALTAASSGVDVAMAVADVATKRPREPEDPPVAVAAAAALAATPIATAKEREEAKAAEATVAATALKDLDERASKRMAVEASSSTSLNDPKWLQPHPKRDTLFGQLKGEIGDNVAQLFALQTTWMESSLSLLRSTIEVYDLHRNLQMGNQAPSGAQPFYLQLTDADAKRKQGIDYERSARVAFDDLYTRMKTTERDQIAVLIDAAINEAQDRYILARNAIACGLYSTTTPATSIEAALVQLTGTQLEDVDWASVSMAVPWVGDVPEGMMRAWATLWPQTPQTPPTMVTEGAEIKEKPAKERSAAPGRIKTILQNQTKRFEVDGDIHILLGNEKDGLFALVKRVLQTFRPEQTVGFQVELSDLKATESKLREVKEFNVKLEILQNKLTQARDVLRSNLKHDEGRHATEGKSTAYGPAKQKFDAIDPLLGEASGYAKDMKSLQDVMVARCTTLKGAAEAKREAERAEREEERQKKKQKADDKTMAPFLVSSAKTAKVVEEFNKSIEKELLEVKVDQNGTFTVGEERHLSADAILTKHVIPFLDSAKSAAKNNAKLGRLASRGIVTWAKSVNPTVEGEDQSDYELPMDIDEKYEKARERFNTIKKVYLGRVELTKPHMDRTAWMQENIDRIVGGFEPYGVEATTQAAEVFRHVKIAASTFVKRGFGAVIKPNPDFGQGSYDKVLSEIKNSAPRLDELVKEKKEEFTRIADEVSQLFEAFAMYFLEPNDSDTQKLKNLGNSMVDLKQRAEKVQVPMEMWHFRAATVIYYVGMAENTAQMVSQMTEEAQQTLRDQIAIGPPGCPPVDSRQDLVNMATRLYSQFLEDSRDVSNKFEGCDHSRVQRDWERAEMERMVGSYAEALFSEALDLLTSSSGATGSEKNPLVRLTKLLEMPRENITALTTGDDEEKKNLTQLAARFRNLRDESATQDPSAYKYTPRSIGLDERQGYAETMIATVKASAAILAKKFNAATDDIKDKDDLQEGLFAIVHVANRLMEYSMSRSMAGFDSIRTDEAYQEVYSQVQMLTLMSILKADKTTSLLAPAKSSAGADEKSFGDLFRLVDYPGSTLAVSPTDLPGLMNLIYMIANQSIVLTNMLEYDGVRLDDAYRLRSVNLLYNVIEPAIERAQRVTEVAAKLAGDVVEYGAKSSMPDVYLDQIREIYQQLLGSEKWGVAKVEDVRANFSSINEAINDVAFTLDSMRDTSSTGMVVESGPAADPSSSMVVESGPAADPSSSMTNAMASAIQTLAGAMMGSKGVSDPLVKQRTNVLAEEMTRYETFRQYCYEQEGDPSNEMLQLQMQLFEAQIEVVLSGLLHTASSVASAMQELGLVVGAHMAMGDDDELKSKLGEIDSKYGNTGQLSGLIGYNRIASASETVTIPSLKKKLKRLLDENDPYSIFLQFDKQLQEAPADEATDAGSSSKRKATAAAQPEHDRSEYSVLLEDLGFESMEVNPYVYTPRGVPLVGDDLTNYINSNEGKREVYEALVDDAYVLAAEEVTTRFIYCLDPDETKTGVAQWTKNSTLVEWRDGCASCAVYRSFLDDRVDAANAQLKDVLTEIATLKMLIEEEKNGGEGGGEGGGGSGELNRVQGDSKGNMPTYASREGGEEAMGNENGGYSVLSRLCKYINSKDGVLTAKVKADEPVREWDHLARALRPLRSPYREDCIHATSMQHAIETFTLSRVLYTESLQVCKAENAGGGYTDNADGDGGDGESVSFNTETNLQNYAVLKTQKLYCKTEEDTELLSRPSRFLFYPSVKFAIPMQAAEAGGEPAMSPMGMPMTTVSHVMMISFTPQMDPMFPSGDLKHIETTRTNMMFKVNVSCEPISPENVKWSQKCIGFSHQTLPTWNKLETDIKENLTQELKGHLPVKWYEWDQSIANFSGSVALANDGDPEDPPTELKIEFSPETMDLTRFFTMPVLRVPPQSTDSKELLKDSSILLVNESMLSLGAMAVQQLSQKLTREDTASPCGGSEPLAVFEPSTAMVGVASALLKGLQKGVSKQKAISPGHVNVSAQPMSIGAANNTEQQSVVTISPTGPKDAASLPSSVKEMDGPKATTPAASKGLITTKFHKNEFTSQLPDAALKNIQTTATFRSRIGLNQLSRLASIVGIEKEDQAKVVSDAQKILLAASTRRLHTYIRRFELHTHILRSLSDPPPA